MPTASPRTALPPSGRALEDMARDGLAVVEGDRVRVTALVRPYLRTLCAVFDRYLQPEQARHSQAV